MSATVVNIDLNNTYKVLVAYDNENGNDVVNNTEDNSTETVGKNVFIGLTATDGKTLDRKYDVRLGVGETHNYPAGLGAGRNIVIYRQKLGSTLVDEYVTVS